MSYRRLDALESRVGKMHVSEHEDVLDTLSRRFRDDPIGLAQHVFHFDSAHRRSDHSVYQDEILGDLAGHPQVGVLSGHGVGKTATIAMAIYWWVLTRPGSLCILAAPQYDRQVRLINMRELMRWGRRAVVPLPVEVQSGRMLVENGAIVVGIPATEPDRIEGFHSDAGVLLVMDEVKGIGQNVFDALMGMLTSHSENRLLVCSTPGGTSGPFHRICTKGGNDWRIHRISSEDSSMVSPRWCEMRAREWGKDSPLYRARVCGEFSSEGDGILIPLSLLEAAMSRTLDVSDSSVTLGVDVARSVAGDHNCIAVCRGGKLERLVLWRSPDTMATVDRVIHEVVRTNPRKIRVDESGVGAGVVDRLRQLRYPVEGVAFGGAADDPSRHLNRRAQMFWDLRDGLEAGRVVLPDDDELAADLSSLRYEFTQRGQIKLESKDDCRKRLGRSPDRADALALALGVGGRAQRPWTTFRWNP